MPKIVFTNGCFDILHPGHVRFLEEAKALGTKLIVGINSDASVRSIKGPTRPVQDQDSRRAVLLGLRSVDEVLVFEQSTPEDIIKDIKPDILVKGGDWTIDQIIGGDFVRSYGGEVFSLPLLNGHSSSNIVARLTSSGDSLESNKDSPIAASLGQHQEIFSSLLAGHQRSIERCADIICETFRGGGKVLLVGNGGSAADAQHIAAEFVGRYETERRALPAIALTTDTSALTALANDYDFERIFARQVNALACEGDCLIAISTSGTSPNILAAVMAARAKGCRVVGMTGENGKKLAGLSDACILVPSERTARVQEAHITIAHIWCEIVDKWLESEKPGPA
ncbi:MAG: D-glycero-beta-D-manno-heptose 1-phosphate adenylyltransferase [Acidobacteriota bacterium]